MGGVRDRERIVHDGLRFGLSPARLPTWMRIANWPALGLIFIDGLSS
jgi:hypothetical protein